VQSVKVTDANGAPSPNVSITFAVTGGGGSLLSSTSVLTNASGIATATWKLGSVAGTNTLRATAPAGVTTGNPATFTATGIAGAATSMTVDNGNGQQARVSMNVPVPPRVKVVDAYGNPVAGRTVVFAVATGGGSVAPASVVTTSAGLAQVTNWTLGAALGANTLTATSAPLAPLTFNALAVVVVAPTGFHATGCSTSTSNGKVYATYTTAWTMGVGNVGVPSSEIGESSTNVSSTAAVIWSGLAGTTQNLGPYLTGPTGSSPRYFWVRHKKGINLSTWAPLDLFPITFVNGCQA
jgi:hypothetical protein